MKAPILHSTPIWLPQTLTWLYTQVKAAQEIGVDAHVVCERMQNLDQFHVANIHCLAGEPRYRQLWDKGLRVARMRRHLGFLVTTGREVGAKIVHSHFGHIGWRNLEAVRQLGVRHVVTFYGLDVNKLPTQFPIWRRRYRELFDEVDMVLCEGGHMAKCILALGCPSAKVQVQHLGVDLGKLTYLPREWHPGQSLKILIAASFREKKGIPDAIAAVGMLSKDIPVKLTIIGDAGKDAESRLEKERILDGLRRHNLMHCTRMLGYQPHEVLVQEAYQHHVFLSPSLTARDGDTEGGAPVALSEMAATGMPIVSTSHCDIPEIVQHGITGLLAPERDVEALYGHLGWLKEHYGLWEDMLKAGRQHVEREYSLSKQALRLAALYESLLKSEVVQVA
jgi:colanic acid/amylovoran biosynthesis glycosyltransferase